MQTVCPACDYFYALDAALNHCPNCGIRLRKDLLPRCRYCSCPVNPTSKFCGGCGHTALDALSVSEDEKDWCPKCECIATGNFCRICGTELELRNPPRCPTCKEEVNRQLDQFCKGCGRNLTDGELAEE